MAKVGLVVIGMVVGVGACCAWFVWYFRNTFR